MTHDPSTPAPSYDRDGEHLRLLSIFHYVVAAMTALFGSIPLFHLGFGLFLLFSDEAANETEAHWAGAIMAVIGAVLVLGAWTLATCIVIAGRSLVRRKRYTFCLVVAALSCLLMPFGTALGIFTIIVLMRESVRSSFGVRTAVTSAD